MKMIPTKTLLLCLSVALTMAVVLTQRAAAKETEHLILAETYSVGGTVLEAGTYTLTWEGAGPQVQVTFMRGGKTIVTAPARLVLEANKYDGAVRAKALDNKTKVLEGILWKKRSLIFEPSV